MSKRRLSASVDAALLTEAEAAVKQGRAANLSAWVNSAMEHQLEHERRLAALDLFLEDFEAEHGAVTAQDIVEASRWARDRAVVSSPARSRASSRRRSA